MSTLEWVKAFNAIKVEGTCDACDTAPATRWYDNTSRRLCAVIECESELDRLYYASATAVDEESDDDY